jgi:hypothetical protein
MNLHELLNTNQLIPGDGSMYELLRRSPEVECDDHIAYGGLIYHPGWVRVLEREPESFALVNMRLLEAHDIRVIGGCCGTNPEHIQTIVRLV